MPSIHAGSVEVGREVDGVITANTDTEQGKQLEAWLADGVPGLVGTIDGDEVRDSMGVIAPDDPLFGLALLEQFEEIGWTVEDDIETDKHRILKSDVDMTPPRGVVSACKNGLERHEAGETGSGLEPATVMWAKRFSRGEKCSPERARQGNRWWGRNARFLDFDQGTPAYAAAQLWGGRAGKAWFSRMVRQLDKAFCPTGEGGGVDNTCSPGGGSGGDGSEGKVRRSRVLEEIQESASKVAFIEDVVTGTTEVDRNDLDGIENSLDDRAQRRLERYLDEQRAMFVEAHSDSYDPEIPDDVVEERLGIDQDSVDENVREILDGDALDAFESEVYLRYTTGSEYVESVMRELDDKLDNESRASLQNLVDKLDEEFQHAKQELEDQDRENYEQEVANDYDDFEDKKEWLQGYYDDNIDHFTDHSDKSFNVWGKDKNGDDVYLFETSDGREFEIMSFGKTAGTLTGKTIEFSDDEGSYGKTGKGGAFEVFSKVVPVILAYAKKAGSDFFHFSAEGASRQKLYDRLVKTVAAANPEYIALSSYDSKNSLKHYAIVNESKKDEITAAVRLNVGQLDGRPLEFQEVRSFGMVLKGPEEEESPDWKEMDDDFDPEWMTEEGWEDFNEDQKAFCPTGPGGGVDNSCSPGGGGSGPALAPDTGSGKYSKPKTIADRPQYKETGKLAGVSVGHWGGMNASAKSAAKKVKQMEEMYAAGDVSGLMEFKSDYGPGMNNYQKTVVQAKMNLLQKVVDDAKKTPEAKTPQEEKSGVVKFDSSWKKVGGQLGSQEAAQYIAPSGDKYYVKFPKSPEIARNEVLASNLVKLAGGNAVTNTLVELEDGGIGMASKWTETKKANFNDAATRELAAKDFAVHAWLANWDVIGMPGDETNLQEVTNPDGTKSLISVDTGGAMKFKATGGSKPFGNTVPEWDAMRNKSINPSAGKVFGDMTPQQLHDSAQKVASIKDEDIKAMAAKFGGKDHEAIAATLIARKNDIAQKAAALGIGKSEAEPDYSAEDAPPNDDTIDLTYDPNGSGGPGTVSTEKESEVVPPSLPAPPVITSKQNASYQKHINAVYDLAVAGDVEGLKAYKTNATSKQTYASKLHKYKMQLLDAVSGGAKPSESKKDAVDKAVQAAAKAPSVNAKLLPPAPTFVSSNAAQVAKNNALASEALNFASSGDIEGLKAMQLTPSPKLQQYHNSLVQNVAMQLSGKQPVSSSGTLIAEKVAPASTSTIQEIANKISVTGTDAKQKVGYWLVDGDAGGKPVDAPHQAEEWKSGWNKTPNQFTEGNASYLSLPKDIRQEIKNYTGYWSSDHNNALRFGKLTDSAIKSSLGIDEASVNITPGTVLSRKYKAHDDAHVQGLLESVGKVVHDDGILSTSINPGAWSGNVQWKITVGEGVRMLPANSFSQNSGHEKEYLGIPRQRMLITKVQKEGGTAYVHAIMLPYCESQTAHIRAEADKRGIKYKKGSK